MTLIGLALLGSLGLFMRSHGWPLGTLCIAIGFFGFPLVYGYISWPVGKRYPDREWWGMIGVMVLFALMILWR